MASLDCLAGAVLVRAAYRPLHRLVPAGPPISAVLIPREWALVLIASGAACGQVPDRSGGPDAIVYICLTVAMALPALLRQTRFAVPLTLLFGLVGMAPAGLPGAQRALR